MMCYRMHIFGKSDEDCSCDVRRETGQLLTAKMEAIKLGSAGIETFNKLEALELEEEILFHDSNMHKRSDCLHSGLRPRSNATLFSIYIIVDGDSIFIHSSDSVCQKFTYILQTLFVKYLHKSFQFSF